MESKTYVFGNEGGCQSGMLGMLAPLLQKNGLDPNLLLAMNRNGNGFGGEGGWFIWVIFLFFLMGWGNNGWGNGFGGGNRGGGGALANEINNDYGRTMLMEAINGNGCAINNLATSLNCSVGQIQNAINGVMGQVQNVSNAVGQSSLQVINALQQGNMQIAQQIAQCCCDEKLAICQQTNALQTSISGVATGQERGFANIAYETQRQTCDVRDAIRENTAQVLEGQRAAEAREMQRELAERDRKIAEQAVVINNGQQTAIFGQMINQATAPIASAVAGLKSDVDGIKCKLPETATVPYQPFTAIPNCIAWNYGLYGGFNPANGGWG